MGVKWILLWNPSPGASGTTVAIGDNRGGQGGAQQQQQQKPAPPFSGRAVFDVVSAAVARVCGPPLPGAPWRAEVSLLRSSVAGDAAATPATTSKNSTARAPPPADLVAVSFGDDPSSLHLVCERGRNVLTADATSSGPLIAACGGYAPRARLHLSGPRFAAGGLGYGDAGAVVARVAPRPGDPPRAVAVVVSLDSASDVAEAAPALREFAEALRSSVRKLAEEANEAASAAAAMASAAGGDPLRQPPTAFPEGTLEPLAAPLAEFALPRAPQGPQHAAVQVAALFSAVLSRPRGQ